MAGRKIDKTKTVQEKQEVKEEQEIKEEQEVTKEKEVQEKQEVKEEQFEEQEQKPKKLYATYPILFESHQYKVGEQLPTTNMEMVNAWLESETAIWRHDEV